MQRLRRALVAFGAAAGAAGVAALAAAGCSNSSNSTGPQDSGPSDSEVSDAQPDTSQPDEGADSSVADSTAADTTSPPVDSGTIDSSTADADAAFDAGPGPLEFAYAEALGQAYCQNQLGCCPGGLDSGTYDLLKCEDQFGGYGWEANLPSTYGLFARGFIQFDASKAAACIAAVQSLPCGTQTATQWGAVTSACEGVLFGNIPIGQFGCLSSFECVSGSYCSAPNDGGTGVCTALATQGQACDTAIMSSYDTVPDYMCSYLGNSMTGLYCDLIDPVGSANYAKCEPLISTPAGNCVNATTFYYDDQACGAASGGPVRRHGLRYYGVVSICSILHGELEGGLSRS